MIEPEVLADRMQKCAVLLIASGPVAWERWSNWEKATPRPFRESLDDDQDARAAAGRSAEVEEDRKGDAAASRYHDEAKKLTREIESRIARLSKIVAIACPANPDNLKSMDKLQAQVEADGYCGSCWRADQEWVESAKGRYRGRCTWCGERRAELGQDPPSWLVRKHLASGPGSRITTADMERARRERK